MKIKYETYSDFKKVNRKLAGYLRWWSNHTFGESRMLKRPVEFFKENLVHSVFAFHNNKLVGASGLILPLNHKGEKMYYKDKLALELGSLFVIDDEFLIGNTRYKYRDNPIVRVGTHLVHERIHICREENYFPTSVTNSGPVQQIYEKIGVNMQDVSKKNDELAYIFKEIRKCECLDKDKPFCQVCPRKQKNGDDKLIWCFKEFL